MTPYTVSLWVFQDLSSLNFHFFCSCLNLWGFCLFIFILLFCFTFEPHLTTLRNYSWKSAGGYLECWGLNLDQHHASCMPSILPAVILLQPLFTSLAGDLCLQLYDVWMWICDVLYVEYVWMCVCVCVCVVCVCLLNVYLSLAENWLPGLLLQEVEIWSLFTQRYKVCSLNDYYEGDPGENV